MSLLFICGNDGCDVVSIDEHAFAVARDNRYCWADQRKQVTGLFPSMSDQEEYFMAEYQRLTEINIHKDNNGKPPVD